MSSFNICGSFQLKAGHHVSVSKPNNTYLTDYAHYNTNVRCISNTTVPTDLRVYVTSTTQLLLDGMVSFAVCTAQSTTIPPMADYPASNSLTLDALTFGVLPGDPSSDIYNVCSFAFFNSQLM
jgi:hypothetical protein